MKIDKQTSKNIAKIGAFLIVLTFALFQFEVLRSAIGRIISVLAPFLAGAIIALFINVPLRHIEKFLRTTIFKNSKAKDTLIRGIAVLIAVLIVLAIIGFTLGTVLPDFIDIILKFADNLPAVADSIFRFLDRVIKSEDPLIMEIKNRIENKTDELAGLIRTYITSALVGSINIVTNTFSFVFSLFVSLTFTIYLLFYKERLFKNISKTLYAFLSDEKAEVIIILIRRAIDSYSNFISGTSIEAVIYGLMNFIAMTILRMPYRTTLTLLASFMTFVPYFGAIIAGLIGFVLIAAINFKQAIVFIIMTVILQQFEGNIIYPRVVGSQVGLPGIWVMTSVAIGGSVGGIVGMVIAVPLTTLIYFTLRDIVEYKTERKKVAKEGKNPDQVQLSQIMKNTNKK